MIEFEVRKSNLELFEPGTGLIEGAKIKIFQKLPDVSFPTYFEDLNCNFR